MDRITYVVRSVDRDGNVVFKEEYKEIGPALDKVRRQVERGRKAIVRREIEEAQFRIIPAEDWGRRAHTPYSYAPPKLKTIFLHTSVTKHLEASALKRTEMAEMRNVDNIAFGRGFNGFSYNFGVFASGRAYEGRGFRVVEAATDPYNFESDSICFIGNTDAFKPTDAAIDAVVAIIKLGQKRGHYAETLDIRGHREVAPKACPGRYVTDQMIAAVQARVN